MLVLTFVILEFVGFANIFNLGSAHAQFVLATLNSLIQGLWLIITLFGLFGCMIYVFIKYLCFLRVQFNLFSKPTSATGPRYIFYSSLQKRISFVSIHILILISALSEITLFFHIWCKFHVTSLCKASNIFITLPLSNLKLLSYGDSDILVKNIMNRKITPKKVWQVKKNLCMTEYIHLDISSSVEAS